MLEVDRPPHPLADPGEHAAARPGAQRLVPRLDVMERSGEQPRHRCHDDEVLEAPVCDLALDPIELGVADHGSTTVSEDSAAARIDDEQPDRPKIPPVGPHRALGPIRLPVRRLGEHPQGGLGVGQATRDLVHLVGLEAGRRQVAEMLVDPVRHQRAGDPLLPPVGLLHVEAPGVRGVPVVAHIVVVEDHRARQRRQEPADRRLAPRLVVEPRVLLEVGDLGLGRRMSRRVLMNSWIAGEVSSA